MGFHCVDCRKADAAATPTPRTAIGGRGGQQRPVVTYTLIAICVGVFVLQQMYRPLTGEGAFVPRLAAEEPWRFLTSAFLHSPDMFTHILFNMLCLWAIGQWLEPMLGWARFLALYLVSALGGSVGFLLLAFPPQSTADGPGGWFTPMVGASGAVFGLFGATVLFLRHTGASVRGMWILLGINAALPLIYPQIAWQAHLGGFITGLAVAAALLQTRGRERARLQWPVIGGVLLVVIALAAVKYLTVDTQFVDTLVVRYSG